MWLVSDVYRERDGVCVWLVSDVYRERDGVCVVSVGRIQSVMVCVCG